MKIEMGESLFYSWLRHVKECQIVQVNWKPSTQWKLENLEEIEVFLERVDEHFRSKHGYEIFKKNRSILQMIQQTECDAVGISGSSGEFYGVDVAFHSAGLQYGSKDVTIMKLLSKAVKTAVCFRGYLGTKEGNIIFASPKIHKGVLEDLLPCVEELNQIFQEYQWQFGYRVICNKEFQLAILDPVLLLSDGVADTTELFMRSYQMIQMFSDTSERESLYIENEAISNAIRTGERKPVSIGEKSCEELKIGQLAQALFRKYFHEQRVEESVLDLLLSKRESKRILNVNFPVFVESGSEFSTVRYYASPFLVNGREFYLTSQWFEGSRPYLLRWIQTL